MLNAGTQVLLHHALICQAFKQLVKVLHSFSHHGPRILAAGPVDKFVTSLPGPNPHQHPHHFPDRPSSTTKLRPSRRFLSFTSLLILPRAFLKHPALASASEQFEEHIESAMRWSRRVTACNSVHVASSESRPRPAPGYKNGYFDSQVLSRQHAELWRGRREGAYTRLTRGTIFDLYMRRFSSRMSKVQTGLSLTANG